MGFAKKINITSDFIFQHLEDIDIFAAYRNGDVQVGAIESSVFRQERRVDIDNAKREQVDNTLRNNPAVGDKDCGVGTEKFCAHYAIEKVEQLPAHQYDEAVKACLDFKNKRPLANG